MSEFDSDKAALLGELGVEREQLEKVLRGLSTADLTLARRGSWAVSKIVDHVLHSERLYAQLVCVFSGTPVAPAEAADLESGAAIVATLSASRKALLDAVSAVGEGDFYRLQTIGHEEYSVLSILENVAAHDREHADQIRKTLGAA